MIYCVKCGNKMPEDNLFCGKCGHRVDSEDDEVEIDEEGYSDSNSNSYTLASNNNNLSWSTIRFLKDLPLIGKIFNYSSVPENNRTEDDSIKNVLYVITFFVPIVGLIIGGIYSTNEDYEKRIIGKNMMVLGLIMIVVIGIIVSVIISNNKDY